MTGSGRLRDCEPCPVNTYSNAPGSSQVGPAIPTRLARVSARVHAQVPVRTVSAQGTQLPKVTHAMAYGQAQAAAHLIALQSRHK